MTTFFITGSGRSGTTSLLSALGLSPAVKIGLEPEPTLNVESREMFEGRLQTPYSALASSVIPRIANAMDQGFVYVEKHLSFMPFVSHLNDILDCKFIIPIRDGRDVVASFVNWHNQMFPIIYQECAESAPLSIRAQKILDNQVGIDTFDYSLPRPSEFDPWHSAWPNFSRFEMVSWYWSYVNNYLFDKLALLPEDRYLVVDYTNPSVSAIKKVYDFIGLPDFDHDSVSALLNSKVNSLDDRVGEQGVFPKYSGWDAKLTQRFWDIAGGTMVKLGFTPSGVRPPPVGLNYKARDRGANAALDSMFEFWYMSVKSDILSAAQVSLHIDYNYTDLFHDIRFVGVALSGHADAPEVGVGRNVHHQFLHADVMQENLGVKADCVFSQGVVDDTYDVDAFVKSIAKMSSRYVYISSDSGYFGGMTDHRIRWDAVNNRFNNDISVLKIKSVLHSEGFATVVALPVVTEREDFPITSVVIACRDLVSIDQLVAGHKIYMKFDDYSVNSAISTVDDVVAMVNSGCAYFSDSGLGLANSLSYFEAMLVDLRGMASRRLGSMRELMAPEAHCNTAIRLDVDMDLVAALELAKVADKFNVPLSFYILHTASYYGYMHEGVFYRHEASANIYRAIQDLGCEVGLHVDALGLYLEHGVDGSQAVEQELSWLRGQGVNIYGTTAHNCAPVYGAENFEIFKGRSIRQAPFFSRNQTFIPLEMLDEQLLGLEYDGSRAGRCEKYIDPETNPYLVSLPKGDFLRDKQWFKTYIMDSGYCDWGDGYKVWLLGKDMWAIAGRSVTGIETFEFAVSWTQVRDFVASVASVETIIFTLHPIYLGARRAAGEYPIPVGG